MKNKEKNFVSAVVYVHNAEKRIEKFLSIIISVLQKNFTQSELICVNDNSTDNSLELIKKISKTCTETSLSVVNMSYFHGVEGAMNAGMDLSIGDFVFEFDNTIPDFTEEDVINVYKKALEGYDIVAAAPNVKEKFTSRIFYKLFNKFSNSSYKIQTESFRILSRRVINRTTSIYKKIPYRKETYASQGLKMDTYRYNVSYVDKKTYDKKERKYRSSLAFDLFLLFTGIGYKLSMIITVIMFFISAFMLVYSIIIFVTANPIAGWTTTILFLSVAFFGLFAILTIVIKYLQLLLNLVFRRKHYSFEGIEKLTK